MSERLRAAYHLHTNYSSDGKTSLAELAAAARRLDWRCLLLADHLEDFSPEIFDKYLAECAQLSDSKLLIIPGVEVKTAEGYHLAFVGVNKLPAGETTRTLIEDARAQGALVTLCHPAQNRTPGPCDWMELLHGVEFWNARSSSRFAPDIQSLRFAENLRRQFPHIQYFPALDLHYTWELRDLDLSLRTDRLEPQAILSALKDGNFETENFFWGISVGRRGPSGLQKIFFRAVDAFRRLVQRFSHK